MSHKIDLSRWNVPELRVRMEDMGGNWGLLQLKMTCRDVDANDGSMQLVFAERPYLPSLVDTMTEPARKEWLFKVVLEVLEHELAECLFIDGERAREPHPEIAQRGPTPTTTTTTETPTEPKP